MNKRIKTGGNPGQLGWVILLLAIAVILPTVCLLWFMSKAVKNVQLAAQQMLINTYEEELGQATQEIDNVWQENLKLLDERAANKKAFEIFRNLTDLGYDGALVYDELGGRIYPVLINDIEKPVEPATIFGDAWQAEFAEHNYKKAARLYERHAKSDDSYVRFAALIAQSRSLLKTGGGDELRRAAEVCKKVALSPEENDCDTSTLMLIANSRLLLAKLTDLVEGGNSPEFWQVCLKLLEIIDKENEAGAFLPSEQRVLLARKILQIYRTSEFLKPQGRQIDEEGLERLIAAEELSIRLAERFPTTSVLQNWPNDQFRPIKQRKNVIYSLRHDVGDRIILLLCGEKIMQSLRLLEKAFKDSDAAYRILDDSGRFIAGPAELKGNPFIRLDAGEYFPGWKTELYFKDSDVFKKAASREIAVYIWAGVLVIFLILLAGSFAARVVGRQMKLNRLKNDFIATVSHELKTPLASMRVLVDTLLEGNYKDQQQATEYLRLTSRENERLSRLIDNFLTFSRMERSKQAFEMLQVSPAAIARRAVEAVKTKFEQADCKFDVSINERLPQVLADHDAMVTALMNLLDNAFKYSYDDKRIELRVFAEDGSVCFRVADNGIGLSRRAAKKIFSRFYQVDRSLSRRTEGCGLGLSIVKFIVDGHKGSISVDSKPGKGSTFTVKIPRA